MKCLNLTFALLIIIPAYSQETTKDEIASIASRYRIPGISLSHFDGETTHKITVGVKERDQKDSVNIETIFGGASLGKPILAYITLIFVENKKLNLDTPLYKYYENKTISALEESKLVTPRMVLTHQSGLPNWFGEKAEFSELPGTTFGYSGEAFNWLMRALESIEQESFNQIALNYVFKPLKMTRSSFTWKKDFENNYAKPHDEVMNVRKKRKYKIPSAASSLQTTADDYMKFLLEVAQPTLLSQNLRDEMISPQIKLKTYKKDEESVSWGLGIAIQETPDGREIWHWGNNGTERSFFSISVPKKKGVVYFTNSRNGLAMTDKITDLFLGSDQPGYRWNGFKRDGVLVRMTSTFKRKN